jgi:hypothetical protein
MNNELSSLYNSASFLNVITPIRTCLQHIARIPRHDDQSKTERHFEYLYARSPTKKCLRSFPVDLQKSLSG